MHRFVGELRPEENIHMFMRLESKGQGSWFTAAVKLTCHKKADQIGPFTLCPLNLHVSLISSGLIMGNDKCFEYTVWAFDLDFSHITAVIKCTLWLQNVCFTITNEDCLISVRKSKRIFKGRQMYCKQAVVNVDTSTVCLFHYTLFVCCIHIDWIPGTPPVSADFSMLQNHWHAAGISNIISVQSLFVDIFEQILTPLLFTQISSCSDDCLTLMFVMLK